MSPPWPPSPRAQSALPLGQNPDTSRGACLPPLQSCGSTEVLAPRVARPSSGRRVKPGVWVSLHSHGQTGAQAEKPGQIQP